MIQVTPVEDGRFCLTKTTPAGAAKLTRSGELVTWSDRSQAERAARALQASEDAKLRAEVLEGELRTKVPGPIRARLREDPGPTTLLLVRDYLRQW